MKTPERKVFRCAIYTRKSTEHNLDLAFNSLDAQREACEAYIKSQAHEGWRPIPDHYDDGGLSGASLDRPALQSLLADVRAGKINIVVVYKVDRLTRSLADFARLVETFDAQGVSFVSVTQQFNTTSSMGRLTHNVLLSFAQFEREVTGERIRDKIAASKQKAGGGERGLVCRFVTHRLWLRFGTTVWRVHGANSFSSSDVNGAGTDPIMEIGSPSAQRNRAVRHRAIW